MISMKRLYEFAKVAFIAVLIHHVLLEPYMVKTSFFDFLISDKQISKGNSTENNQSNLFQLNASCQNKSGSHCFRKPINSNSSVVDDLHSWRNSKGNNNSVDDHLPDIRLVRKMFLQGFDESGLPFPPPIARNSCTIEETSMKEMEDTKYLIDGVPIRAVNDSNINTTIVCLIYTVEEAHSSRVKAIRESWAGMCDGFLAFSTKSDFSIPSISIPHNGNETYWNMWQKVRSIWKFVATQYLHEFDYFLIGGDDIFVILQNLRLYLSNLNGTSNDHHFVGRRFRKPGTNYYFYSGGSGYVISRGTLKTFLDKGYSSCHVDAESSEEDVLFADCLEKIASIGVIDTSDEQRRERFHPFSPQTHLLWRPESPLNYGWYKEYSSDWGLQYGLNCCSPESISFHYISNPVMMSHLYCLIYDTRHKIENSDQIP